MAMTSARVLMSAETPGDETPAEGLRVERGEDVAEMIMRRRPACERPKAAQESELLLAKTRDVGEGLGPCQYGQQAQEQDLVERINDLARLPMVRHVFEISKKNRRLGQRRAITSRLSHRTILRPESEDVDRFSSNPFCHLLLHPIALSARAEPGLFGCDITGNGPGLHRVGLLTGDAQTGRI